MTSDKSGPVRTAPPALEEDLEITRDRKDVKGEPASAETPDSKQAEADSGKASASTKKTGAATSGAADGGSDAASENTDLLSGPVAVPAPPVKAAGPRPSAEAPVPPAPEESGVPTTGGIWRSAYEAGRPGKESKADAPAASEKSEATAEPGLGSAIGRVSTKNDVPPPPTAAPAPEAAATAKSWNRVPAPDAPPAPPATAPEGSDGVRAGAMKAAQAALATARSAAKKVTSIMPDDDTRSATGAAAGPQAAGATAPQPPPQSASAPTPEVPRPAPAGPRRVRLAISRVDPWSVMKLAFLLAVAIAIMTVVATAVFWSVLDSFGVFTTVQDFVEDAVGPQSDVNLTQFVEFPRVISLATLISICNIVLLTAIATIMAFLYNITAALVGGVHMTLTDD
jgi:hypothetical protein